MLTARHFAPDIAIDRGKKRIAVDAFVHFRDRKPCRQGQDLRIDVGAAGDEDGVGIPPQCVAARHRQSGFEARRDHQSRCGKSAIAAHDDGGAAFERPADRGIGLAPDHHRLAHGQRAEMHHVRFEPPRQAIAAADDAVLGYGGEKDDLWINQNRLATRLRDELFAARALRRGLSRSQNIVRW